MQVHTRGSHGPCFTVASHESQGREHAGFDSHSAEEPEAALSFGPIFSFRARHAFVLYHPITTFTIEPVATSQPGGVMATATGPRVRRPEAEERVLVPELTRWLKPWVCL
jgi:hypothetical protein